MKTFVWLIGKPGSGKTTVGNFLAQSDGIVHFSSSALLKEVQPNPGPEGYSMEDRKKVLEVYFKARDQYDVIIVDGNPYSEMGLHIIDLIAPYFDATHIIHLTIDDDKALARLTERDREVLAHDGTTEEDRLKRFNIKLLPLIEAYKQYEKVIEIDVGDSNSEAVAQKILVEVLDRA